MFTILYLLYNETHERLVKSLFLAYIYNLFPVYDVTMNLSFISRRYRETVRLDLSKKTVWDFIYRPTVLNLFFWRILPAQLAVWFTQHTVNKIS